MCGVCGMSRRVHACACTILTHIALHTPWQDLRRLELELACAGGGALRESMVQWIRSHRDDKLHPEREEKLGGTIVTHSCLWADDFDDYLTKMAKPGTFGDNGILLAVAMRYRVAIEVLSTPTAAMRHRPRIRLAHSASYRDTRSVSLVAIAPYPYRDDSPPRCDTALGQVVSHHLDGDAYVAKSHVITLEQPAPTHTITVVHIPEVHYVGTVAIGQGTAGEAPRLEVGSAVASPAPASSALAGSAFIYSGPDAAAPAATAAPIKQVHQGCDVACMLAD